MTRAVAETPPQDVRFCRSADSTRLAYAVHGTGPPLLLASCWLSHLEFDWRSPVWRRFLLDLGRFATVVRYQAAGRTFLVCPICFNAKGLDQTQLIKSAEMGGTVPLWRWIGDGATTFSY